MIVRIIREVGMRDFWNMFLVAFVLGLVFCLPLLIAVLVLV